MFDCDKSSSKKTSSLLRKIAETIRLRKRATINSNAKWLEMIIYFPEFLPEDSDRIFDCIDENHINQIEKIIFLRIAFFQRIKLKKFDQFAVEENSHF